MGNGKGTPWGPMESGRPDTPAYQEYDTNIQHFMDSPQIRQAVEDAALQCGDAQRAYMAGRSKMLGSGTTSGSNQGALANIAALAEKNRNNMTTGLAQSQMDAFNRARQAANEFKQRQYGIDLGAYNNEENARGQATGQMAQAAALLAMLAL